MSDGQTAGDWPQLYFCQAEDGMRHWSVTGVQTCALPIWTAPVLLKACEGDPALLRRMCDWFRERVPGHLAALAAARQARDGTRLRETAHKLCGMLSTFSDRKSVV